ncbi:Signal transduction histidine kinase [Solimonas aquatica]|uniref:histidine kinase n=1 Tax=Solimonas aquatica TaxID=489703 RepID=A0A1H9L9R2_9GAMM|nr:ATP-binding protein [Solimonas aquatica]SER07875.1 Signal transduction histidine kinase [Solimonas aquatica]
MSLRNLLGLLVLLSALLAPAITFVILEIFPPPPPLVLGPCVGKEQPQDARGLCLHQDRPRPPPESPPLLMGLGLKPPPDAGHPPPPAQMAPGQRLPPEAFAGMRQHFFLVNLLSLAVIAVLAMLVSTLTVRRPVRRLLEAIRDIRHGSVPQLREQAMPRELREIGQALQQLGLQLRRNNEERDLMLASMSHDLRSPLARIQAAVQLRGRPEADWLPVLRDVGEIDHIIEQCIAWVRDGRDEPTVRISLDELVRQLLRGDQDQVVELDLQAPREQALRRLSLARAIRNLLDNALTHGAAPVRLSTREREGELILRVSDHGPGICEKDWEHFLKPFVQGARERKPGGAGLGLAIVNRLAEQQGGRLCLLPAAPGRDFAIELHLPSRL